MIGETAKAAVRRALWRAERRVTSERALNFMMQGYQGEDLLRRIAGIPLVRECKHHNQGGPFCGLCGGALLDVKPELPPADPLLMTPADPWGQWWVPVLAMIAGMLVPFVVIVIANILTLEY